MKLLKALFPAILLAGALCSCEQKVNYYQNPVIPANVADPTVLRVGDTYYLAGTGGGRDGVYPRYQSKDLVNWEKTGFVFSKAPEWTSGSYWAPEFFQNPNNGKFYVYYTAKSKELGIVVVGVGVADDMESDFTDCGPLITFGTEDIDAFVYNDNGQLYITWKAYGLDPRPDEILGCKLSADGLSLEGEPFTVLRDDERLGMEGQCIFKCGEYIYALWSARLCCGAKSDYEVRVARTKSMSEPFVKYEDNPILMGGDGDFQSCGHGTLTFSPDGRMFYICHAYMRGDDFRRGRLPVLHEFELTEDAWIRCTTGKVAVATAPVPFKGVEQTPVVFPELPQRPQRPQGQPAPDGAPAPQAN